MLSAVIDARSMEIVVTNPVCFNQGLYPPVGSTLGQQTLRNGTVVESPLNGYQLVTLQQITNGANSENSAWLQGSTNCANAQISSNNYFTSTEYLTTLADTGNFYSSLSPMINRTFNSAQTSFKNAYTIYDLLNVASIHNSSSNFPNADLLTPETFFQARTLADQHEYGLAYNVSEPIRAVTGAIMAGQVVEALNGTITGLGKNKFNIQFGAYAGMLSFFGLAQLPQVNPDFYGIPDYASSLSWELVTNATVNDSSFPSDNDISVRFYFHNGTTSESSQPVEYPLFGTNRSPLPWSDFTAAMGKFSISGQDQWCQACGNSTGVCSPNALGLGNSSGIGTNSADSTSENATGGISKAVAGVIGAMVTLGVVLSLELLFIFVGGYKLVSKRRLMRTLSVDSAPAGMAKGNVEPKV